MIAWFHCDNMCAETAITGKMSHADRFHEGVVKFLADYGSNGVAWRVDAAFGVFGSLPLVGVRFDDAYVLLDTTDGTLDGPFDLASPLDASVLLAQHGAYVSGTTVRYRNASGCKVVAGPTWIPWPRPGPIPAIPGTTPAVPLPHTPSAPRPPNTIPGNPTSWSCQTQGTGPGLKCVCESMEYWDDLTVPPVSPMNRRIRVRTVCTYPLTSCTATSYPPTVNPAAPPPSAGPPVVVPTLTPTCETHFEWWT